MSRVAHSLIPLRIPLGIPLGIALGAAAGCASSSDELIDYRVTGGFSGRGDGTSLQLRTDGTGTRTTTAGTQPVVLDRAALTALNRQIADAQFPSLQPSYGCHGCVDQLVFELAVQVNGHRYEVRDDQGNTSSPESLRALLSTLQQIAPP
jgi:hypothetical protein